MLFLVQTVIFKSQNIERFILCNTGSYFVFIKHQTAAAIKVYVSLFFFLIAIAVEKYNMYIKTYITNK